MRAFGILSANNHNRIINSDRVNRNITNNIEMKKDFQNKDSVFISKKGKNANVLENLTKQKAAIEERKNKFLGESIEKGKSIEQIEDQLELYDEQMKNIDKQIAEIKQLEESAQKTSDNNENKNFTYNNKDYKTKNEKNIENITKASLSLDRTSVIQSVKNNVDSEIGVLKSEISLDKKRGFDTEEKEIELLNLEVKSSELNMNIADEISKVDEKEVEGGYKTQQSLYNDKFEDGNLGERKILNEDTNKFSYNLQKE